MPYDKDSLTKAKYIIWEQIEEGRWIPRPASSALVALDILTSAHHGDVIVTTPVPISINVSE